jgi:hypothetical protein
MIEIPLFNKEIEANIGDLVKNSYSLNYLSLLEPSESFDLNEKFIQSLKASEGDEDVPFDLEFKKSVFISCAVVEPIRDKLFKLAIVVDENTPFTVDVIEFKISPA